MEVDRALQRENLGILVKNKGFQFTDSFFPYTSGEIGPYYVNSEVVMANGNDYARAVNSFAVLITRRFIKDVDVISGGETRDWIFSNPLAYKLGLPHASLYKDGKMIGANMSGKFVLPVADLNNEGSSPRDLWIPTIKRAGGTAKEIMFYVDRLENGVQVMKDLGLISHAVVPLDEVAWEELREGNVVTEEQYKTLMDRTRMGKDNWARAMLQSEKGLLQLMSLAGGDEKNKGKARKILEKGYPDLAPELRTRLFHRGIGI